MNKSKQEKPLSFEPIGKFAKIARADCLEAMGHIPDESIDMILCDMPYGCTRNKWDSILNLEKVWSCYSRVIKPSGAIVLFASGMFTAKLMQSNSRVWRYNLIWKKTTPTGFLNASRMPLRSHEDICVFYKRLPTYHPQKTASVRKVSTANHKRNSKATTNYGSYAPKTYDSTLRYPVSVIEFKTDRQHEAYHPTQKPVALLEYLIRTYTNEGDTVLDNCMGSGSTGVACLRTNRRFIGIEIDDDYYRVAKERLRREKVKGEHEEGVNANEQSHGKVGISAGSSGAPSGSRLLTDGRACSI